MQHQSPLRQRAAVVLCLALTLLLTSGAFPLSSPASAGPPPDGFTDHLVTEGLSLPTDVAFLPDGRILVVQQHGAIRVIEGGTLLSDPAITLSAGTGGDRGLLSVAADPDFSTNGYIYVLYTSSALKQRISRLTMVGNTISPASELILLENPKSWSGFLNAGAVRIGPNGMLYASFGSNGEGAGAQDISSLEGKMVRINRDGTIPPDNPYAGTPGARAEIYASGFRNPWRFSFGPDGTAILGDVGESSFEKVVRIAAGANYGWPTVEGDCRPTCGGITPPLFVIPHDGAGSAVVGGAIGTSASFPAPYAGAYFFGDYVQGTIQAAVFNGSGGIASIEPFITDSALNALAGIYNGPDGCLYYLTIFPGKLRRVCADGVSAVEAVAEADITYGELPLDVQFLGDASVGESLSYIWTFGDGASSTEVNPLHTYTTQGVYTATLSVSDGTNMSSESITIWAGYQPPEITTMLPAQGTMFSTGDTIAYSATARDPAIGEPLPPEAFTWRVYLHHNIHVHSPHEAHGVASGTFETDLHDADSWYRFELIVTNSVGLSTVMNKEIFPNTATLTIDTDPAGIPITLDFQPTTTPIREETLVNFTRTITAESPVTVGGTTYVFDFWSDGGAQTHDITMPAEDVHYRAVYAPTDDPPPPPPGSWMTSVSPAPHTVAPGGTVTLTTTVTPPTSGSILVDTEISGASGAKVLQDYGTVVGVAGVPVSRSWTFTAPATEGAYTMKIGVFAPDWSSLHTWNDMAGTLTVSGDDPPPPPPGVWLSSVSPSDASASAAGESVTLTTTVTPPESGSILIDTEIYNTSDTKILQNFATVVGVAGVPVSRTWTFPAPAAGSYLVKTGVFAPDWSSLHIWDGTAGTLTVGEDEPPPPPPPATFVVLADMPDTVFDPGEFTSISTRVTATSSVPDVNILTEIYNSSGVKVAGTAEHTDLLANVQFISAWPLTLPAEEGPYVVRVGVFNADYSHLYFWKDSGWRFTIGDAPGPPEPGVTYDIELIDLADGDTVSGVKEVKARIGELDIDTYNIGWRTGGGTFFFLDTDPITRLFKHAWIDFSGWSWIPSGFYPLEFQATDTAGNVIGGETITVHVDN